MLALLTSGITGTLVRFKEDHHMESIKSLDELKLIANVLRDVSVTHRSWFSTVDCEQTISKIASRFNSEGIGFLTKTLPSLGKALDKALSCGSPFDPTDCGFQPMEGRVYPQFLGAFFERVLSAAGNPLIPGCAISVRVIRQIAYLFYKYELPYTTDQEQAVLSQFLKTETELIDTDSDLRLVREWMTYSVDSPIRRLTAPRMVKIARAARAALHELFRHFDPLDIVPSHGPGAVSTGEKPWEKFNWRSIPSRLTDIYPLDAYFCACLGHVCDDHRKWSSIDDVSEVPARVCLVPKDSRGPRLISCEPPALQWIQQGQRKALYKLVENHPLTKWNVFFTNQVPNQCGALLGSQASSECYGGEGYATLDLKEASDRVSLELVRLLFPSGLLGALESSRSLFTKLPCGRIIPLRKFAPMGSALCFPIMALTIWSLLYGSQSDASARESILVYGDDVIVPLRVAEDAISVLEAFGLKVNRDKSCTKGPFRESCGMDAYQGVCVTPVRLRTVWTKTPSADSFESFVCYANEFYRRGYFCTYEYIVGALTSLYWPIAGKEMHIAAPSLIETPDQQDVPWRTNKRLQKRQWFVTDVCPSTRRKPLSGWTMLLRYLTGAVSSVDPDMRVSRLKVLWAEGGDLDIDPSPFSVSLYTERRSGMLGRCWR
jgi:hypothetical protein